MSLSATTVLTRGATAFFTTTFYDQSGVITQPTTATINLVYPSAADGSPQPVSIAMVAPVSPAVAWTAQWDSRNAGVGSVAWSIHSDPGPPFAVEDGNFTLAANAANLVTFA